jgi:hypothetical protein
VRRHSDALLIFLLKARQPGKCSDKVQTERSGHITISWLQDGEAPPLPREQARRHLPEPPGRL